VQTGNCWYVPHKHRRHTLHPVLHIRKRQNGFTLPAMKKSVMEWGVRGQRGASKWLATVQFDQKRTKAMAGEVVALI
jgi:hypothetical protein